MLLTLHQLPRPKAECQAAQCGTRVRHRASQPPIGNWIETLHSNRNLSPATGKSYEPLTPKHFSFNAPAGACPVCHGLGQKLVFDEGLVVPDPEKSLEQGAILPWRRGGKRMVVYYKALLRGVAQHYQQSLETPYKDAAGGFQARAALAVRARRRSSSHFWRAGKMSKVTRPFEGVIPNLERLYQESESEFTRNRLKGFMSPQFCDACSGQRLKPEILAVTLGDAAQKSGVRVSSRRSADPRQRLGRPRSATRQTRLHSRPLHHGRLRAVGGAGRRVLRRL